MKRKFGRIIKFCEELRPLEDLHYIERSFNDSLISLAKKYNLLGMPVSKEYGGLGLSACEYADALSIIAEEGTGIRTFFSGHSSLGQKTLEEFGSPFLKRKYLGPSTKGEIILAFALTEPESGSDPLALKTKYRQSPQGYLLNGTKYLISNSTIADAIIVFAKGDNNKISAFVVDSSTKGIAGESLTAKMGMPSTNTGLFSLQNVLVPRRNLIGKINEGWKIAKHALMNGRLSVAAGCVGIIRDCLNEAARFAKERVQHKKVIAKHQLIQEHLALIKLCLESSRLMTQRAAKLKDAYAAKRSRELFLKADAAIAEAKLFAANAAFDAADRAVQILGGRGWSFIYRPGRHFVDNRVCRIYEGTDEILKLKIAAHILGSEYAAFS